VTGLAAALAATAFAPLRRLKSLQKNQLTGQLSTAMS
jgi:hypothetical protein